MTNARGGAVVVAVAGAILVAGCSREAAPPAATNNAAAASPARPTQPPKVPVPATEAFSVEDRSDLLDFGYSYPAQAAAVPEIADKLRDRMRDTKEDALAMAREDRKAAKDSGYPFRQHSLETHWSVEADTPRFLSLIGETYTYTGGAHGMTGYATLLWDRQDGREISVPALMTSQGAFAKAVGDRFCDALDAAREEKRGEPVKRGADDFSDCIDPLRQTLVPMSENGKAIDRIEVVIGPYEAGPYAEGSYEIPLAVDAAMLSAVKPEYRAAFAHP